MDKDNGTNSPKQIDFTVHNFSRFHLEFLWPNVWQNYLYNQARILLAFVPIDENETLIYMRYYHHIPIIGGIVRYLGLSYSKRILQEDHDVVIHQKPNYSTSTMNEVLLRQEKPIVLYRQERKRRNLY